MGSQISNTGREITTAAGNGGVRAMLQIEGAAALAIAVTVYAGTGSSWWLFAALFLAPDLSMAGYALGNRIGAVCYNLAHTYAGPALLIIAGALFLPALLPFGLVWVAHIGFDRMVGYGLKYPTGFRDTHLSGAGRH